ncbi:hypothetical protein [Mycobacterium sp. PS03-16]|uniref:hypothetical protein n=1 Tax=Mycobacterium sp. PS03-16 TaxID=2559611 RepID=UPI0014305955|nr:hypothetical protein [Mycobacterium sp. PS03-16]
MSHPDTPDRDEYVQRAVDAAPPLSAEQRKALATLLQIDTAAMAKRAAGSTSD